MNPSMLFRVSTVGLILLAGAGGAVVACSSSTPGQVMPPNDSGTPTDSGGKHDSGKTKDGGVKPSDSGSEDVSDSGTGLPDVGSCVSDSSSCNSCYSFPATADAEVPLNACSSAVGNCVKFAGSLPDCGAGMTCP
jgi:hypothetical protein